MSRTLSMGRAARRILTAASLALLGLTGCTTTVIQSEALPISSASQCAAPEGVSVRYNSLYIAVGKRPNTGYGVELVSQLRQQDTYQFTYRETSPVAGQRYGQMQTNPCLIIVMPKHWDKAFVVNEHTGQQWRVTPAEDSTLSELDKQ